jgi:integrase
LGTLARLVFDIALYTTARKADITRLNAGMIRKDRRGRDTLVYVAHKLSAKRPVRVFQPIFPELQASLDAARASGVLGEMLFIVQKKHPGRPEKGFSPDTIANYMQDWVDEALTKAGLEHPRGPTGYSLHGLRKSGVCGLILRGVRDREIMAITGHRDPREIDLYGREYMRSLGAEAAFDQWQSHQQKLAFNENEFEADFA